MNEEEISDTGKAVNNVSHKWAILMFKEYTGVYDSTRAIISTKRPLNRSLIFPQGKKVNMFLAVV